MFLYLRMGLSIIVNLYTVRVIWQVLGVDNYGIYNVVAGIVVMFQFLNGAMVAASQRFISFELGTGNLENLKKVFSASIKVHFLLSIIILILTETIGLWFLNSELNIPSNRMFAANCVYQCSIASLFVNVISVPYNSCIVAHEHMKIYGYYGILNVILKLGIVLLLVVIPYDKLISYAILLLCVEILMRILYQIYCRKHFEECRNNKSNGKGIIKDMFAFAGWSFLGTIGYTYRDQGLNMILNMFFNVAMNAAKGVANQVTTTLSGFATNFTMALNPQITKSYASGDIEGVNKLLIRGSKFSFLLLNVIIVPVFVCCHELLCLWLDSIEPQTIKFLRILLIAVLIESMVSPLSTALQATGRIRRFQITIATIMLLCLPAAWIWLKINLNPYSVVYLVLITNFIALFTRLFLLREQLQFSIRSFCKRTMAICYPMSFVSIILCSLIYRIPFFQVGLIPTLLYLVCALLVCLLIAYLTLTTNERQFFINLIRKHLHLKRIHQ